MIMIKLKLINFFNIYMAKLEIIKKYIFYRKFFVFFLIIKLLNEINCEFIYLLIDIIIINIINNNIFNKFFIFVFIYFIVFFF
jgi:hypothetical protein